ncbi:aldehyde dehydrogenase family protein [Yoonia sp.]|uniref:aldehyde dehydrogenase family protein n=1 Tax=Yoonia sp. TaxID=2212373 RepID=UPI0025D328F5|nr:aldehyde dehydrogenase family protein [Yoonia sp.]
MQEASLVINGERYAAASGLTFDRRDPFSDAVVSRAPAACAAEALKAVNAAAAAFGDWSATPGHARAALLLKAADALGDREDAFFDHMAGEVGASRDWVRFNLKLAQGILRQAAELPALMQDERVQNAAAGTQSIIRHQPAGVIVGFAPWNAPLTLGFRAIAAPLACGNTVVLKGSELCARTHQLVVELLNDVGLPAGVANYVTHAPAQATEIAEAMIGHPAVRRVNFTGSTRVGREIARMAAQSLKPCLLELSGKAPLIVLEDADLDAAAEAAAFGAFFNQGQICMSTERVIVVDSIADAFVAKLGARARAMSAGNPRDDRAQLGPLISAEAALRLGGLIEDAVTRGAQVVAGGSADRAVMQPTVVDHVTSAMRLYHDECFGPIAAVMRVADEDEAVSIANETEFGLSAAVFSRDVDRALGVAGRIDSGMCHINGPTVYDDPNMPFGGTKASGYGRFGGPGAIREFTETRWIAIHDPV